MTTVLILLCFASATTLKDPQEFWLQCSSANATIYATVVVAHSVCLPHDWDLNSLDEEIVAEALPPPENPAWHAPNWVKYECHEGPTP